MRLLQTAPTVGGEVFALAFSPDGEALAAAVKHQGVYLWNLGSTGFPVRLDTDTRRVRTVVFAPDGRSVGWIGWRGWKRYDRDTREATDKPLDPRGYLFDLVQTPDGSRVVTQQHSLTDPALVGWTVGPDGWEQDWSVSTRELAIKALAADPTGCRVAVLCQPTSLTHKSGRWWEDHPTRLDLRSAVSGAIVGSDPYPYHRAEGLVFAPDGSQLVAVHGMMLVIWQPGVSGGPPRLIRNDSRKHFTAVCYHPSGRYLFATSNDTTVHVFDTATWERVTRFTWRLGQLRAVAVSPDGALAAAGTDRGEVVVWDVDL